MKTKISILVIITAIATLSFTVASVSQEKDVKVVPENVNTSNANEPIGGFLQEDPL